MVTEIEPAEILGLGFWTAWSGMRRSPTYSN